MGAGAPVSIGAAALSTALFKRWQALQRALGVPQQAPLSQRLLSLLLRDGALANLTDYH